MISYVVVENTNLKLSATRLQHKVTSVQMSLFSVQLFYTLLWFLLVSDSQGLKIVAQH